MCIWVVQEPRPDSLDKKKEDENSFMHNFDITKSAEVKGSGVN